MDRAATEAADSRDDAAQECVWKTTGLQTSCHTIIFY